MKQFIVVMTLLVLALADEHDIVDHKKRGVSKSSPINSLTNNGHQKPEQLSYTNYQQQSVPPATQPPLYPLAPPSYSSSEVQTPVTHQSAFSFLPPQTQTVPLPYLAHPRFQILSLKTANGQSQLMLIPQNLFYNPQTFAAPSYAPLQSHLFVQPTSSQPQTTHSSTQASSTSQTAYAPQTTNQSPLYQQPLTFGQNPLIGQPSTMFIFTQPSPQLYNNYLTPQSNLVYSQPIQQLLSYYQNNPQAKNQLLYGNAGYQQSQVNSYQTPLSGTEYEKSASGVHQSLSNQKNDADLSLNTNEYLSQTESQFRPVPSYGSRTATTYKN